MKQNSTCIKCDECNFRSQIFTSLSPSQLNQLTCNRTFQHAAKGDTIAKQSDTINGFIFLRVGLAKLTRTTPEGKDQIIGIATPNDFVGLLSIFSSKTYQYSIIAIEESEFCCVSHSVVMDLINSNGSFAISLLQKMSEVSDSLINTRLDLDLRQLRGRVAFIIDYFANTIYHSNHFNLPISRKEIAELIDMRVENVVRILTELKHDNIIRIDGTAIEIMDTDKILQIKTYG